MRLSLLVEPIDPAVDGMVEVIGVGKGAVGEVVPLEVAPAALDGIELGGIFGQPFEREPGPFGERLGGELARMDRTIVHHDDQRLEAFPLAIGLADMVEQTDKVARALGGTGMNEKLALGRVEGPQHRTPLGLARRLDAQVRAAPGPAMRQVRMGARL